MPPTRACSKLRLDRVTRIVLVAAALIALDVRLAGACTPGAPSCLADTAWPMLGHDLSHTGQSPNPGPLSVSDVKIWKGIDRVKSWPHLGTHRTMCSPTIGSDCTIYVAVGCALCAIDPATMTTKKSWNDGQCKRLTGDVSPSSPAIATNAAGTSETIIVGERGNSVNALDVAGN